MSLRASMIRRADSTQIGTCFCIQEAILLENVALLLQSKSGSKGQTDTTTCQSAQIAPSRANAFPRKHFPSLTRRPPSPADQKFVENVLRLAGTYSGGCANTRVSAGGASSNATSACVSADRNSGHPVDSDSVALCF
jgi:hypothetical protein